MLIRLIGTALAAAHAACGLKGASPFFLLSTASLDSSLHSSQISTAAIVRESLLTSLADCSASVYIFVQQPGLSAADIGDGSAMPQMHKRFQSDGYKSTVQIPEMIGKLDVKEMADRLSQNCGIHHADLKDYCEQPGADITSEEDDLLTRNTNKVGGDQRSGGVVLTLETLPLAATGMMRKDMLQQMDSLLEHELSSILMNHTSHVLVYTSAPVSEDEEPKSWQQHYEMDEPLSDAAMHTDLKRNVGSIRPRQQDDPQAGLPLFERYQFLSPAIFMGLLVAILLLIILNVGISAIAGLDVSYMAFSKDMGPQAQQKGKQQ